MRKALLAIVVANCLVTSCGWASPPDAPLTGRREPIVGLPCEGCDEVFNGIPAAMTSTSRIAPSDATGAPLRIEGVVADLRGRPAAGVIVYAYHTDTSGMYPRDEPPRGTRRSRHGQLRAWVKTDEAGRYRFDTIRPASYPSSTIPAHVHMHVIEPGRCTYNIDDVLFDDDPHLTAQERGRLQGRGGKGVAVPRREGKAWVVRRDIVLGEKIPGYPQQR